MSHDVFWWIRDFGYLAVDQIFGYDWCMSDFMRNLRFVCGNDVILDDKVY